MTIQADLVASGLAAPTFAASPPGDPNRLFVTEKNTGRVVILDLATSQVAAQAFFDVPASDLSFEDERGLLGLAFHPNYAANGRLYLNLTNELGDTEIWEVTNAASVRVLLTIDRTAGVTNHNGGWLGFGPDGFLYIASGDSGVGNDPENAAQNTSDLRGKILRIDVDSGAIPAGNPFGNEVFAYGLRNPWRASFDSATGDLYIADVGQNAREEVNYLPAGTGAGTNFGWRALEGTLPTGFPPSPGNAILHMPVVEYEHGFGDFQGFSVTGGYVYRGPGGAQGQYFFADFVSGHVWTLSIEDGRVFDFRQRDHEIVVNGGTLDQIASYGVDGNGRLYAIGLDGEVHRLTPVDDPPAEAAQEPRDDSSDDVEDLLVAGAVIGLAVFAFDDFF
jgi:glucose/arabinose dehydrogenase